jgi:lactate dehydrogenase-like 2-hydroxyacid dehydrogenase
MVAVQLNINSLKRLQQVYTVYTAITHEERVALAAEKGGEIQGILTNGVTILPGELIQSLPKLSIICTQGVGYEGVDVPAALARDIVVAHSPGLNANSVADHALGIMLAILRDIPRNDALVRSGGWRDANTLRPSAYGKRIGLLGMGNIGTRIAQRCAAFDMTISYHSRQPKPELPWNYLSTPLDLAKFSDILVVVVPGDASTRHMIGEAALDALGPNGFLVNVGRGSVVDTDALIAALQSGRLAGAALDVMEGEPDVPQALRDLPNIVLTPHMAGRSPEHLADTIELIIANFEARFAGKPVLTPIPESVPGKGGA